MTWRSAIALAPSERLFRPDRACQVPFYHVGIHIRDFDRISRISANVVHFSGRAASTDGISNDNDKLFLAPDAANPGAQVGKIDLKAAYGHGPMRNDDSLYNGIRLLAVYAF